MYFTQREPSQFNRRMHPSLWAPPWCCLHCFWFFCKGMFHPLEWQVYIPDILPGVWWPLQLNNPEVHLPLAGFRLEAGSRFLIVVACKKTTQNLWQNLVIVLQGENVRSWYNSLCGWQFNNGHVAKLHWLIHYLYGCTLQCSIMNNVSHVSVYTLNKKKEMFKKSKLFFFSG